MASTKVPSPSFSKLLFQAQAALRLNGREFSELLGISTKTLNRYHGRELPPPAKRADFLRRLRNLDRPMLAAIATSLSLEPHDIPAPLSASPQADLEAAKRTVDLALLAAAEAADLSPVVVRKTATTVLRRIVDAGIDARAALAALSVRTPTKDHS